MIDPLVLGSLLVNIGLAVVSSIDFAIETKHRAIVHGLCCTVVVRDNGAGLTFFCPHKNRVAFVFRRKRTCGLCFLRFKINLTSAPRFLLHHAESIYRERSEADAQLGAEMRKDSCVWQPPKASSYKEGCKTFARENTVGGCRGCEETLFSGAIRPAHQAGRPKLYPRFSNGR